MFSTPPLFETAHITNVVANDEKQVINVGFELSFFEFVMMTFLQDRVLIPCLSAANDEYLCRSRTQSLNSLFLTTRRSLTLSGLLRRVLRLFKVLVF